LNIAEYLLDLLQSGFGGIASYLAAHVILCLLPAFFIAGALAALMPKEAITRYLGRDAPKWISYPASALGGFFLAVCSCTIMPLFASIYKKGAGLGPAITFLFVGPAVNILAISFTGVQIGMDIALARIILSLIFGILIGLIMAWVFRKDDNKHAEMTSNNKLFEGKASIPSHVVIFFLLLLSALLVGTLQINLFKRSLFSFGFQAAWAEELQNGLHRLIPANPAMGIEGISIQGLLIIILLILIALAALKGFRKIHEGLNAWTYITLGLITLTLLFAAVSVEVQNGSLTVGPTGRIINDWTNRTVFC